MINQIDTFKVSNFVFKKGIELEDGVNYLFVFKFFNSPYIHVDCYYTFINCAKSMEEAENIILSHYYSENQFNGDIASFIDEKKLLNYLWEKYCVLNTGTFNALLIDGIDFK